MAIEVWRGMHCFRGESYVAKDDKTKNKTCRASALSFLIRRGFRLEAHSSVSVPKLVFYFSVPGLRDWESATVSLGKVRFLRVGVLGGDRETDPSMEDSSKVRDREKPSSSNYRESSNGSICMSGSCNHGNGVQVLTPPLIPVPKFVPRSDLNPYPTTFVQADTSTFKQVVQMLTGSAETAKQAAKPVQEPSPASRNSGIPLIKAAPKKQGFRLYERRPSLKNGLVINTLGINGALRNAGVSPRQQEILSPSWLDFPSLTLSPVTPLNDDPFGKSSPSLGSSSEEEKAIAEKGFYLHPSPRSTPRESKPQLLPLFPVTSPKFPGSSS